jgi:hypothetical protein
MIQEIIESFFSPFQSSTGDQGAITEESRLQNVLHWQSTPRYLAPFQTHRK